MLKVLTVEKRCKLTVDSLYITKGLEQQRVKCLRNKGRTNPRTHHDRAVCVCGADVWNSSPHPPYRTLGLSVRKIFISEILALIWACKQLLLVINTIKMKRASNSKKTNRAKYVSNCFDLPLFEGNRSSPVVSAPLFFVGQDGISVANCFKSLCCSRSCVFIRMEGQR